MRGVSAQSNYSSKGLDREWVQLMKEAREMGLSKREVKQFLQKERPRI
ncbi:SinR repressor domain-containing protein dimerization [Halalkalibacillus sediminis]|uniref:SinR repressor domain-containing protein dimerization n=1 Tax=Halalkalibacillus sediminis TaxID=2018042 RepID=A0A2I0QV11_9BACI|nr:anti-repressor SinI family protein [Halalkalibacillus sediminis]PKR78181.1 SinR repressor domain-containing protein dimerization [Halalkalibacillus sediminis]